jgi:hypothetical protein
MDVFTASNIAKHPDFQDRVKYLMVKAAVAKLNAATPSNADILLGQRILDGGESVAQWALAVVTNATIAAGAHSVNGGTIVDSDLEFTVNSLWAAFSL